MSITLALDATGRVLRSTEVTAGAACMAAEPGEVLVEVGALPPDIPGYDLYCVDGIVEQRPNRDALWDRVRMRRDRLLTACDWTQAPDVPLAAGARAAWAVYRQALRDLPEAQDDPLNIVWPVPPG
jgi:hypothetical protein